MKTINLLDLDNDILNIIGDYVKKDNERRIDKEDDFKKTDFIMNYLKENNKFNNMKLVKPFILNYLKIVIQKKKLKNMWKLED